MADLTAEQVLADIEVWVRGLYERADMRIEVALHGGRFTPEDLARYATRTSACRIALEGLQLELTSRGGLDATAQVVVVLLAGDQGTAGARSLKVLAAATPLLEALPGSRCGTDLQQVIEAESIGSANLYSAALDAKGTAGWVITWPVKFTHPRNRG